MLVANEFLHLRHRDKSTGLLFKLDLEKAYDRVDWDFLSYLLWRMGFGVKWRRWIQECVLTVSFSIVVNGSPQGFFQAQRGLRQGDPLSPFRFVIIGEALSRMLSRAVEAKLISGCRVAFGGLTVLHIQFVDDTVIFYEANEEEVRNVNAIMR